MSKQDKRSDSYKIEIHANDMNGQLAIGHNISQIQGNDPVKEETAIAPETGQVDQSKVNRLRNILINYFNEGELKDICFEIGLDYESLPGDGKRNKARELVAECQRKNKIAVLTSICSQERPHAFK